MVQPGTVRWLSPDEQHAWRGFVQMNALLQLELNRQLQEGHSVSVADYEVLSCVSESPGERLRTGVLASTLKWEQSRLSHHLTRMEKRGLVDRRECDEDRRGTVVQLTAVGREVIHAAAPEHAEAVRRLLFDTLGDEQVAQLAAIARQVLVAATGGDGDEGDARPPSAERREPPPMAHGAS